MTHIRYQNGDKLGHFLAWISLLPVFISLPGFFSYFIFQREIQPIFFFLGLLFNQFISQLVKNFVRQPRPGTCTVLEMCNTHGWPSSHSQFMFFFAIYVTLLLSFKDQPTATVVLVWSLAFLMMWSRVYLVYHTVGQVIAGAVLGVLFGGIWYCVVHHVFYSYFPMIEESKLGRMFYVKDASHIKHVLKFEYDNSRAVRNNNMQSKND
ncbi:hypothetical protein ACFE04_004471 [Oxalis oulophora]